MSNTEQILKERGPRHGDAGPQFAMAQELKSVIRDWATAHTAFADKTLNSVQKEALDMICTKISRVVIGDANFADHWDDIAGYATLVSKNIADVERRGASADLPPLRSEDLVDVTKAV